MKFTISCDIPDRWVPHFLGMLEKMEYLGKVGASRRIAFYSDGDGDYRPKFEWDKNTLPEPFREKDEDLKKGPADEGYFFDAG